ncbi:ribonuclease P protein component [Nocardioides sp. SYSU DS0663]|uniref:ribonuclease P protein component n=1 Tax=Nocardioides sp. SYSU DS0663 TaxID=3416445 RepID=UPI003F4C3B28
MLPPSHRLRDADTFRAAVRAGARAGTRSLVVHLLVPDGTAGSEASPHRDAEPLPPRVGLVVSKAVGGAVVRNQVKRRLRHLAREHVARLPAGSVLVVRALPAAAEAAYATLDADLSRGLRRALPTVPA